MKSLLIFTLLLFIAFNPLRASIVAEGDCDTVKYISGMPSYPGNLYSIVSGSGCRVLALFPGSPMLPHIYLQQYNYSTSTWSTISGAITPPNHYFAGLSHGTYRLYIEVPQTVLSETCPVHGTPGPIEVYNTAFQLIGYVGNWYGDASGTYYSNQVFVGHTVDTDISYTFVDVPETGAELAYDDGENVTINTSACKNSDLWRLAIFEDGPTYHRYWALGWFNGPVSSLDLSFLWDDMVGNNFEPYHSYTVQFAVENKSCINSSWNNLDRTFFICPSGTGCRLGEDPDQISIYPNPAYSTINLNNFTPDLGRIYQVYIFDFLGRAIKQVQLTSNEVDVSDLANGIYSLVVQENKKQIFVSKLIISH